MEEITINVNGKDFLAQIPMDDSEKILLNGKSVDIRLLKQYSTNILSFSVDNKMMLIELDVHENGQSYINADGFYHEIDITNNTKRMIQKYLRESGLGVESSHAKVKAPMPGMIIKILVEEGAHVEKGDKLIIIEAMKMENAISSPIKGKILHVKAREGSAVEKDAFLIEIEAE